MYMHKHSCTQAPMCSCIAVFLADFLIPYFPDGSLVPTSPPLYLSSSPFLPASLSTLWHHPCRTTDVRDLVSGINFTAARLSSQGKGQATENTMTDIVYGVCRMGEEGGWRTRREGKMEGRREGKREEESRQGRKGGWRGVHDQLLAVISRECSAGGKEGGEF